MDGRGQTAGFCSWTAEMRSILQPIIRNTFAYRPYLNKVRYSSGRNMNGQEDRRFVSTHIRTNTGLRRLGYDGPALNAQKEAAGSSRVGVELSDPPCGGSSFISSSVHAINLST